MWKQLTIVSIPIFKGDKRSYESWKVAYTACINQAPATPEYKLLQMRQHLSGEALKVFEGLGHSAPASEAAKYRLERKYGGQRRRVNFYLEEVNNFRPVKPGNAIDLDIFADLLNILVVYLRKSKLLEELANGSLDLKSQKNLSEVMLANYQRLIYRNASIKRPLLFNSPPRINAPYFKFLFSINAPLIKRPLRIDAPISLPFDISKDEMIPC